MLVDIDDQVTETPHLVAVAVKDDQPPQIATAIRGIGSAVTPDVRFPVAGKVTDDYWLDRAWLSLEIGDAPARELALPVKPGGFDKEQTAQWEVNEDDNP